MFVWPVRVYYEDTDSGGVVYYANYLKFMERARTEWLRSLGVEQDDLIDRDKVIFAVHSLALDYLQPARFNDLVWVTAAVEKPGRASLVFSQSIVRPPSDRRNAPTGRLDSSVYEELIADKAGMLCSGRVKVACLDSASMRPRPIPTQLQAEICRVG
jgi:acyl-CoA thioester hydrolase